MRESAAPGRVVNAAPQHYSLSMSNPPDPAELAKRYVALWQDYLSATAADADLADAMARFLAAMLGAFATYRPSAGAARSAAPSTAAAEPSADGGDRPTDEESAPAAASAIRTEASGPTAAAAPPEQRDDALADIARRLALIEKRIAALEARTREGGAGPRGFARRRRF
jgi:hypothetical protein